MKTPKHKKMMEQPANPKDLAGAKKPDLSLIPPVALLECALAMTEGAIKYGPYNWREKEIRARTYSAAAMRHILQWQDGEDKDPLSQVNHLGHAMACCAIALDAMANDSMLDDRHKGDFADRLRAAASTVSSLKKQFSQNDQDKIAPQKQNLPG